MIVMQKIQPSFLPVYRGEGRPVPRWFREAQRALVLGKIQVVSAEQVEAEGGRGYHYAGEHGGICFAWRRIDGIDSFDFELVSIAASD